MFSCSPNQPNREYRRVALGRREEEAQPRDCRKNTKGAIVTETQSRTRTQQQKSSKMTASNTHPSNNNCKYQQCRLPSQKTLVSLMNREIKFVLGWRDYSAIKDCDQTKKKQNRYFFGIYARKVYLASKISAT